MYARSNMAVIKTYNNTIQLKYYKCNSVPILVCRSSALVTIVSKLIIIFVQFFVFCI